jgi:hypothetical protein
MTRLGDIVEIGAGYRADHRQLGAIGGGVAPNRGIGAALGGRADAAQQLDVLGGPLGPGRRWQEEEAREGETGERDAETRHGDRAAAAPSAWRSLGAKSSCCTRRTF